MSHFITGQQFIASERSAKGASLIHSYNAATGEQHLVAFHQATPEELNKAVNAALSAYAEFRQTSPEKRAAFLDAIADEIDALDDGFIAEVSRETALSVIRLQGERGRTSVQMRLFAQILRRGDFLGARIDEALPDRLPMARVDLRQMKIGLGPVGVFGASNFPMAFSVAGGDTASALAAGCPVVVKAHSGHLVTSELVAKAIERAVASQNMPKGVFNMVYGEEIGRDLTLHPGIKAIGFTGSLKGGRALFNLASNRPDPIPFFAEMSSVNPVWLMPKALEQRVKQIAKDAADSVVMGCGQFCTNPGLFVGVKSEAMTQFVDAMRKEMMMRPQQVMLNKQTLHSYMAGIESLKAVEGVRVLVENEMQDPYAAPYLFEADESLLFDSNHILEHEVFGPSTVIVQLESTKALQRFFEHLQGQLTITLQADATDLTDHQHILPLLEHKAGRVLVNGYPTGVEVCDAMVHGGPYPATTDARGTSVGSLAIDRFLRPVCYQNYPDEMLPAALKRSNPLEITRLVNGVLTKK